mmetsp:Transcript_22466/g.48923  ORF Transcript_22466/g.48923 Transcript_22466/m.48923 type:complete len:243 (+) Transcript_22466:66-794(+)
MKKEMSGPAAPSLAVVGAKISILLLQIGGFHFDTFTIVEFFFLLVVYHKWLAFFLRHGHGRRHAIVLSVHAAFVRVVGVVVVVVLRSRRRGHPGLSKQVLFSLVRRCVAVAAVGFGILEIVKVIRFGEAFHFVASLLLGLSALVSHNKHEGNHQHHHSSNTAHDGGSVEVRRASRGGIFIVTQRTVDARVGGGGGGRRCGFGGDHGRGGSRRRSGRRLGDIVHALISQFIHSRKKGHQVSES